MISCNTSALLKQLEEVKLTAERKMKGMVVLFSYYVTLSLGENTPVGDVEAIDPDGNFFRPTYYKLYKNRADKFGIPIEVGFHAGAWQFSKTANIQFDNNIHEVEEAAYHVRAFAKQNYKLGDTFYIGANGPAYGFLESGGSPKAPQGIMGPTMLEIMSIYSLDLAKYYKMAA